MHRIRTCALIFVLSQAPLAFVNVDWSIVGAYCIGSVPIADAMEGAFAHSSLLRHDSNSMLRLVIRVSSALPVFYSTLSILFVNRFCAKRCSCICS